jgi:hypothetical protein
MNDEQTDQGVEVGGSESAAEGWHSLSQRHALYAALSSLEVAIVTALEEPSALRGSPSIAAQLKESLGLLRTHLDATLSRGQGHP